MQIEIKEVSQCVRELKIVIPSQQAAQDYNSILNSFRKYAAIPGFRKGKAPTAMIERTYGPSIKEEYYNQKLNEYYKTAIKEKDVNPVSQADAVSVDWDKGKDLTAVFRFEIMPEINIEKFKNLEIPYEKTVFKPEMIKASLNEFQYKMGTEEETDGPIEQNDKLKLSIIVPADSGPRTITRELIQDNNQFSASFNKKLIGLKKGDSLSSKLFTKSQEVSDKDFDDKLRDREFEINIDEIKRIRLPELNDDFAKDLEFESFAKLEEKVGNDLRQKIEKENRDRLKAALITKIIEVNPFELPVSMIRHYAENMAKSYAEMYKMDIEKLIPMYMQIAEYNLKSHYIIEDLIKKESVKVTEDEKEKLINEAAGHMNLELEKYKELYKKQIESEDFEFAAAENKLIDLLEQNSKFVPYPKEPVETEDGSADKSKKTEKK